MKYFRFSRSERPRVVRPLVTVFSVGVAIQLITTVPATARTYYWWRRVRVVPTQTKVVPTQTRKRRPSRAVKAGKRRKALTAAPAHPPAKQATDPKWLEQRAHEKINQYRAQHDLPPLQWNETIAAQARKHSKAMAQGKTPFSHQGFSQRVKATKLAFRSAAENVAYNYGHDDPVAVAVKGWLKSPGHERNIRGKFTIAGIGVSRNDEGEVYFTQVFLNDR